MNVPEEDYELLRDEINVLQNDLRRAVENQTEFVVMLERTTRERDAALVGLAATTPWASGICSAHQMPDPMCNRCHPALAEHDANVRADERAATLGDQENVERVLNGQPVAHVFSHSGLAEHDAKGRAAAMEDIARHFEARTVLRHPADEIRSIIVGHTALAKKGTP